MIEINEMETGVVTDIHFSNGKFALIDLKSDKGKVFSATGPALRGAQVGDKLTLFGDWVVNPKYGTQFKTVAISIE